MSLQPNRNYQFWQLNQLERTPLLLAFERRLHAYPHVYSTKA